MSVGRSASLACYITKLELEIPAIKKEMEDMKRDIKRADHEFELISRKIGLSKQGSSCVADIIASNENTMLVSRPSLLVSVGQYVNYKRKQKH